MGNVSYFSFPFAFLGLEGFGRERASRVEQRLICVDKVSRPSKQKQPEEEDEEAELRKLQAEMAM